MENKNIQLPVVNFENKEVGKVTLPSDLFGVTPNEFVVQKAIKVTLANARQATSKTKGISEVSGSGKKPWRQKGTGRARAGSRRSPIWVGGATIFGPNGQQNYKLKNNKREHFKALCSVLSSKVADNKVVVLESTEFSSPKTKDMVKALKGLNLNGKVLFNVGDLTEELFNKSKNLILSTGNIPGFKLVSSDVLSVYDILNSDYVVFTKDFIDSLNVDEEKVETKEAE